MTETVVVHQQQVATVVVEVLRTHVVAVQEPSSTQAAVQSAIAVVQGMQQGTLVVQPVMQTAVVAVGIQGPPGRDAAAVTGALREQNRLSEYAGDQEAHSDVQRNIGLAFDPLAYYILAKA